MRIAMLLQIKSLQKKKKKAIGKILRNYKLEYRPELDPFLRRRRFCRILQKLKNTTKPINSSNITKD